jgi:hypothetical protein
MSARLELLILVVLAETCDVLQLLSAYEVDDTLDTVPFGSNLLFDETLGQHWDVLVEPGCGDEERFLIQVAHASR